MEQVGENNQIGYVRNDQVTLYVAQSLLETCFGYIF